jgi:hypothetical protein
MLHLGDLRLLRRRLSARRLKLLSLLLVALCDTQAPSISAVSGTTRAAGTWSIFMAESPNGITVAGQSVPEPQP